MSLGRGPIALAAATTMALGMVAFGASGCSFLKPKVPAPADTAAAIDASCLVGSWHQTEGWQRLPVDNEAPLQIRLISGGRDFTVTANGTATVTYTTPALWKGKNDDQELEATFTGSASLTYKAADGSWSEVADNTKVVTTIKLNGKTDAPRNGSTGRTFDGTYRCSPTDLVLAGTDYRLVFKRA